MLNNPRRLTNQELLDLFMKESTRLMEGLNLQVPHNQLNEIHLSLKKVMSEMLQRREQGRLRCC